MSTENSNSGNAGAVASSELAKQSAARIAVAGNATPAPTSSTAPTEAEGIIAAANDFLKEYQEKMQPGQEVSMEVGVQLQTRLWRTFKSILNLSGKDFIDGYRNLLAWVLQNRGGVCNEKYAYRFLAHLKTVQAKDRVAFERLLAFMMSTCDPKTRAQVYKRYDTSYVYKTFDGTDVEAKLVEFYTV